MDQFTNWGGTPPSGTQGWYGQPAQSGYVNNQNTNVCKVISLDEAIMKSNIRPSENVYFHQDRPEFYNVRVDVNGNKTWQTFIYSLPVAQPTNQETISKQAFEELAARVSALEGIKEVPENGKSNG